MFALGPWIAEVQVNALQLSRRKHFLRIVNIGKCDFEVRRRLLPCRFPDRPGLLRRTAD
ncbi:hypothetical protein D3C86_1777810 [compost metagenome]